MTIKNIYIIYIYFQKHIILYIYFQKHLYYMGKHIYYISTEKDIGTIGVNFDIRQDKESSNQLQTNSS